MQNNQIPTYYVANQVGTNAVLIRYWYFYAWQSGCFAGAGSHAADWESMAVLLVGGQLRRVAWFQHGGWYSHEAGDFQTVGAHPIGYVGKNTHGTYDDGGSGGCLYFEDFRNPGGNDFRMDTWNNLVPLRRGDDDFAVQVKHSNQCLDIAGGALNDGGQLVQWPCAWTTNESFRFEL